MGGGSGKHKSKMGESDQETSEYGMKNANLGGEDRAGQGLEAE